MDMTKALLFLLLFIAININATTSNPCAIDSYSLQCVNHLTTGEEVKNETWMKTAVVQIVTALDKYNEDILPTYKTCGYTDSYCRAEINMVIEQIIKPVFDQIIKSGNRPYLKSIGFATSDNTYIAIYNCTSSYEKKTLKFCRAGIKSFIGAKLIANNSGLQIRSYDDAKYPPQLVTTLQQPFIPDSRPWYKDTIKYGKRDQAFATGIYPNYFTGHAVTGFTTRSKNSNYTALVLTYVSDRK